MNIETKLGPFIKSDDNVSKIMKRVIYALIPIILFSIYKNGVLLYIKGYTNFFGMAYPLIFITLGMMSSLVGEELYYIIFKKQRGDELVHSVKNSYGYIPGLFLSLVVPINTPLAILFIGGLFASIIGKMIYGGLGQNIFNPALVGALFIMICYGVLISGRGGYINRLELDTISSATPLTNYKIVKTVTYDKVVAPYGNFSDFIIGFIPGTLGEVSSILILLSFVYLVITKSIKWRITVSYVVSFLIMVSLYTVFNGIGLWNIPFQLLTGGILFGSLFMATDPVTSPISIKGQITYGILLGILTFLIRCLTGYPEGVMISILIMNIFVLFIDKIGSRMPFNKLYYLYYVPILVLLIGAPIYLGIKNRPSEVDDSEFKIKSVYKEGNNTIYEVSQKGFGGYIDAKITFDEMNITNIEILKHYESEDRFNLIQSANYIEDLAKGKEVDTVTSATITSNALKDMVKNTMDKFLSSSGGVKVISKESNRNSLIYVVRVSGESGMMDIQVVIKNGDIRTVIPINYSDKCMMELDKDENCTYCMEDYIKELIMNQNDLDKVEVIKEAPVTSEALKKVMTYVKGLGD